jgi:hypothetical protein
MATWGVGLFRGGLAGHVFAVAADKARIEKQNSDKPAAERTQPKREWQAEQTRHALAEALSEVLTDLRTGTGDAPAAPAAAAAGAASSGAAASGAAANGAPANGGAAASTDTSATGSAPAAAGSAAATATTSSGAADGTSATAASDRRDGEHPIREAVRDFMHALFEALRPNQGDGGGQGRGFGWGRTSVADLAQRIESLAQSFATPSTPPASGDGAPPAPAVGASGDVPATPLPVPATPADGAPVSATTSQVTTGQATTNSATASPAATTTSDSKPTSTSEPTPTSTPVASSTPTADSSLLQAFTALLDVLPGDRASAAAANPSEALSSMLHRLAQSLEGDDGGDARPATGCLIHVTA